LTFWQHYKKWWKLGGGAWLEEVGHGGGMPLKGIACLWLLYLSSSQFPGCMRTASFLRHALTPCGLHLATGLKGMDPGDHELKPAGKINLPSFTLIYLGISSQQRKVTDTFILLIILIV
jgi:hypothetical protein